MGEKYIPLYRKYRPKNLQEVVGQEHIKKALTNTITLSKISHAYLFTGPRGTGKTSIARILAKSLNCQEGPTLTPCEVCPSCIDIKNSTMIDVIEIDAASNRKVEDAQNILEKIQYVPVNGRYKIYIIDEVHMLTNHAFNALLKTLEEPPENVIFILATTEPQKVLETITSRCQRFDFRRITTDDIVNHLKTIAKEEKINIEDEAVFTIAKNSAGGMRDSLALLDQVSVLGSSTSITSEDVNKLLGRISFDVLNNLADKIIQSQPQAAIELLETIYNNGNEPSQILNNMLAYLKNLLIVKTCQGAELLATLTQLNNTQIEALKTQSEHIETHQITFLIEKIVYYIKELKTTTNQYLWLEVAMIDLANLAENTSLLQLQERISRLESGSFGTQNAKCKMQNVIKETGNRKQEIDGKVSSQELVVSSDSIAPQPNLTNQLPDNSTEKTPHSSAPQLLSSSAEIPPYSSEQNYSTPEEEPPMPMSKPAVKSDNDLISNWHELLQHVSSAPTVSLLTQHSKPIEISEEKIIIGSKDNFVKILGSDAKKAAIEEAAKKMFNKNVSVIIKSASAEDFSVSEKKNLIEERGKRKEEREEGERETVNGERNEANSSTIEITTPIENPSTLQPFPSATADPLTEDDIDEDDDFVEHELAKKIPEKYVPSDQVSMVMNLFDGKYIE